MSDNTMTRSKLSAPVRLTILLGALAVSFALFYYAHRPQQKPPDLRLLKKLSSTTIAANPTFGMDLLTKLHRTHKDNLIVSPYGANAVLVMALTGARGKTASEMRQGLHLGNLSIDRIDSDSSIINKTLSGDDPNVEIETANGIWVANNLHLNPAYIALCQKSLGSDVTSLDFSVPSAADTINQWASDRTQGKIAHVVDPITVANADLILTNAVYFHGNWTTKFDESETSNEPFGTGHAHAHQVPMMHNTFDLGYSENSLYQMVALPYGNGRWQFVVALPKPGRTADEVISSLDKKSFSTETSHLKQTYVQLSLPRFNFKTTTDLKAPLKSMGMKECFLPNADFSGMGISGLGISDVVQDTYINVDEQGATAAAVTTVYVTAGIEEEPKPIIMNVNHPFVFAIQDTKTGLILFTGVMDNPMIHYSSEALDLS